MPAVYWDRRGFWLSEWVTAQRAAHAEGRLESFRALQLEALPRWTWTAHRGRPAPPLAASVDDAILAAMADLARERPTPPGDLIVPLGQGALGHLTREDIHPLAAWTVREALPLWLRRVGETYHAHELAEWEGLTPDEAPRRSGYDMMVNRRSYSWRALHNRFNETRRALEDRITQALQLAPRLRRRSSLARPPLWDSPLEQAAGALAWDDAWIGVTPTDDPEYQVQREARHVAGRALLLLSVRRVVDRATPTDADIAVARLAAAARREPENVGRPYLSTVRGPTTRVIDRETSAVARDPLLATWRFGLREGTTLWAAVMNEASDQDVVAVNRARRRAAIRLGDPYSRRYPRDLDDSVTAPERVRHALRASRAWDQLGPRDRIRVALRDARARARTELVGRLGFTAVDWAGADPGGCPGVVVEWRGSRRARPDPDEVEPGAPQQVTLQTDPYGGRTPGYTRRAARVPYALLTLPKHSGLAVHRANALAAATAARWDAQREAARALRALRIAEADAAMEAARGTPDAEPLRLQAGRVRRQKIETPPPHALTGITLVLARPHTARDAATGRQRDEAVWLRAAEGTGRGAAAALERGHLAVEHGAVVRVRTEHRADAAKAIRVPHGVNELLVVHPGAFAWDTHPASWRVLLTAGASAADEDEEALAGDTPPTDMPTSGHAPTGAGAPDESPDAVPTVARGIGSAARSRMPDGTVVESRDERFEENVLALREFAATNGHLFPGKRDRPRGINVYVFLQRMERAWREDRLPPERRAYLEALPEWQARLRRDRPTDAAPVEDDAEPPHEAALGPAPVSPPRAKSPPATSSQAVAGARGHCPGSSGLAPEASASRPRPSGAQASASAERATLAPAPGPDDVDRALSRRAAWKATWKALQAKERREREARRLAQGAPASGSVPSDATPRGAARACPEDPSAGGA